MGGALLGSAQNILLLLPFVAVCGRLLPFCRRPGWVAGGSGGSRAVGVGGWVRGWVGGWVRGGCQSIELVKLRRFAVLKGEYAPILENPCPSKTFILQFEEVLRGGGFTK